MVQADHRGGRLVQEVISEKASVVNVKLRHVLQDIQPSINQYQTVVLRDHRDGRLVQVVIPERVFVENVQLRHVLHPHIRLMFRNADQPAAKVGA